MEKLQLELSQEKQLEKERKNYSKTKLSTANEKFMFKPHTKY